MKRRTNKVKILICGHDLKFIRPLIVALQSNDLYEIRILEHAGHHLQNIDAANDALSWAQVIFCEWALGNAVWFSQQKRPDQTLIVRLHLQEVQARDRIDFIWQINWERVDRLILITEHLYDWTSAEFPHLREKASLVYNPIPALSTYRVDKSADSRFVLGFVGAVPARKRIDVAFTVLRQLRKLDTRYTLRVKGHLPEHYPWMAQRIEEMAWYRSTFSHAEDLISEGAIVFDAHGSDMAAWYRDIGHILSMSDFEGSHQAVAEGMAAGCVPAIRDWEGAARIYPSRYVRSTVEELVTLIASCNEGEKFLEESERCRSFAARFDNELICARLESIILREIVPKYEQLRRAALSSLLELPSVAILAYIPIGNRGGYRIRVEQEIRALLQIGCKVDLICLVPEQTLLEDANSHAHIESFSRLGCRPHLLAVRDFFRMSVDESAFADTAEAIGEILRKNRIDVLHAEALYCGRVALKVQKQQRTILSIDWHGIVPEESKMAGAHANRIAALEKSEVEILHAADLNIFVSAAMEQHYAKKYGGIDAAAHIVPCCVADARFSSSEHVRRTDDVLVLGYAGTMADWQCGFEMMALFARLYAHDPRYRFTLLIPKSDQAKALEYARTNHLPEASFTLQEVSHDQVAPMMSQCDMGVLIRAHDPVNGVSSPTKFGEYLAAGLPILMTEGIGDFSSLAGRNHLAYILDHKQVASHFADIDKSSLAEITTFVEGCRASRRDIATRCKQLAEEQLSWSDCVAGWVRRYKELNLIM